MAAFGRLRIRRSLLVCPGVGQSNVPGPFQQLAVPRRMLVTELPLKDSAVTVNLKTEERLWAQILEGDMYRFGGRASRHGLVVGVSKPRLVRKDGVSIHVPLAMNGQGRYRKHCRGTLYCQKKKRRA